MLVSTVSDLLWVWARDTVSAGIAFFPEDTGSPTLHFLSEQGLMFYMKMNFCSFQLFLVCSGTFIPIENRNIVD